MRALEPDFEDLRRKERKLDAKENELDREEELIEQDLEDLDADEEAGIAVDGNSRRNLESRRDAIQSRMRDVENEQRQLATVERRLDAREEALEAEAEAKLWRLIDETIESGRRSVHRRQTHGSRRRRRRTATPSRLASYFRRSFRNFSVSGHASCVAFMFAPSRAGWSRRNPWPAPS